MYQQIWCIFCSFYPRLVSTSLLGCVQRSNIALSRNKSSDNSFDLPTLSTFLWTSTQDRLLSDALRSSLKKVRKAPCSSCMQWLLLVPSLTRSFQKQQKSYSTTSRVVHQQRSLQENTASTCPSLLQSQPSLSAANSYDVFRSSECVWRPTHTVLLVIVRAETNLRTSFKSHSSCHKWETLMKVRFVGQPFGIPFPCFQEFIFRLLKPNIPVHVKRMNSMKAFTYTSWLYMSMYHHSPCRISVCLLPQIRRSLLWSHPSWYHTFNAVMTTCVFVRT